MSEHSLVFQTASDRETVNLGKKLGEVLRQGDVIALEGELGCGKTWFTKGLALGLGVSSRSIITSPSFALLNEYEGRYTLYHMDAYRLENISEFLASGLDEYFYQDGVVALEWANRCPEILPDRTIWVHFTFMGDESRSIRLMGQHPRALKILKDLEKSMD